MDFNEYIENRYEIFKDHCVIGQTKKSDDSAVVDDFKLWWEVFIGENKDKYLSDRWKKFLKDGEGEEKYNEYLKNCKKNSSRDYSLYYLMLIIAKHLYKEEIIDENKCTFKQGGSFANRGAYKRKLRDNVFKNGLDVREDKKCPWLWIDILSAIQMEFHLFSSLKDLNEFIRTLYADSKDNQTKGVVIKSFGLYLRRIEDFCFAYTIFSGQNKDFANELIEEVNSIVNESKQHEKYYSINEVFEERGAKITEELNGYIDEKIIRSKLEKKDFIDKVKEIISGWDCYFVGYNLHMTLLNRILDLAGYKNERGVDYVRVINAIYKIILGKNYRDRKECSNELQNNLIQKFVMPEWTEGEVTMGELDLNNSPKNTFPFLRRLLIVVIMMKNSSVSDEKRLNDDCYRSAYALFRSINKELRDNGMPELTISISRGNFLNNENTDLFDWFITECILFDAKKQSEGIARDGISDNMCIRGYEQFVGYISNRLKGK